MKNTWWRTNYIKLRRKSINEEKSIATLQYSIYDLIGLNSNSFQY